MPIKTTELLLMRRTPTSSPAPRACAISVVVATARPITMETNPKEMGMLTLTAPKAWGPKKRPTHMLLYRVVGRLQQIPQKHRPGKRQQMAGMLPLVKSSCLEDNDHRSSYATVFTGLHATILPHLARDCNAKSQSLAGRS